MAIHHVQSDYAMFRVQGHVQGRHRLVWVKIDTEDLPAVFEHTWHLIGDRNAVYPASFIGEPGGKKSARVYMSLGRFLLGDGGYGPLGRVDHRNGNTLDHRRANLRITTQDRLLAKRRPVGGVSRFKGVTWDKRQGKWIAVFRGRKIGRFHVEEDAARAFDEVAAAYWPPEDRPYLNFPPTPHGSPMTGAKARRAIHALQHCLDAQEFQGDPGASHALRHAVELLQKYAAEPREWIQPRDIGWSLPTDSMVESGPDAAELLA